MFTKPFSRVSPFVTLSVLAAVLLAGVSTVQKVADFSASNSTAVESVHGRVLAAFALKADLLAVAAIIEEKVAVAQGKVLDEKVLTEETARAEKFRAVAATLKVLAIAGEAAVDESTVRGPAWSWQYEHALDALDAVDFRAGYAAATALMDDRTLSANVISNAVQAWEIEQARIDAEVARQAQIDAERARAAAAAAVWAANEPHSSTSATGVYNVYVRTTANAANAQSTIDAGGQIAVNYGDGSGIFISAHNHFDAVALRLEVGDTVTFSGAASGTYRVTGSKDVNKFGSTTADVASLGVELKMQTCYFGTDLMRVVGMVRI